MSGSVELTILMPCLNEARTLPTCIRKAREFLVRSGVSGEVLIADNGSVDGSQAIARECGARVIAVEQRGYGAALLGGIQAARGRYVIFGDADDSYDFSALDGFLERLRDGCEVVVGNRFRGGIEKGAMPWLHKYVGNPALSFLGRLLFKVPIGDFHCGLRGFDRHAALRIGLQTSGMEFASEMIVRGSIAGLRFSEVPTRLARDGRGRPPHLRTWRDGWRHLRFLLVFSPRWLFLYPGLLMTMLGVFLMLLLAVYPIPVGAVVLDVHSMLMAAGLAMVGTQCVLFAVIARTFALNSGLLPSDPALVRLWKHITLETGLAVSAVFLLVGVLLSLLGWWEWRSVGYGELVPSVTMRVIIPAVWFLVTGVQGVLSSFLLSLLGMRTIGSPGDR